MKLPFLVLLLTQFNVVNAQPSNPRTIDSAAVTIVTKVPFNGMNYFITIVPIDSANIANMPTYDPTPKRKKTLVWNDSLQFMVPGFYLESLAEVV